MARWLAEEISTSNWCLVLLALVKLQYLWPIAYYPKLKVSGRARRPRTIPRCGSWTMPADKCAFLRHGWGIKNEPHHWYSSYEYKAMHQTGGVEWLHKRTNISLLPTLIHITEVTGYNNTYDRDKMSHKERGRGYHGHDCQPPPHHSRSYDEPRESGQQPHRPRQLPHGDERRHRRQSCNAQSSRRPDQHRGNYMDPCNRRRTSRSRSRSRSAVRYADIVERVPAADIEWADIWSYVQRLTTMYYDGEGTRAWRLRHLQRDRCMCRSMPPSGPGYRGRVKYVKTPWRRKRLGRTASNSFRHFADLSAM